MDEKGVRKTYPNFQTVDGDKVLLAADHEGAKGEVLPSLRHLGHLMRIHPVGLSSAREFGMPAARTEHSKLACFLKRQIVHRTLPVTPVSPPFSRQITRHTLHATRHMPRCRTMRTRRCVHTDATCRQGQRPDDDGGGAVNIGVHVEVGGTEVPLDKELVLARISPAQHEHPATRHKPVKLFKPHFLANLPDASAGSVDNVGSLLLFAASSPRLPLLLLARVHASTHTHRVITGC